MISPFFMELRDVIIKRIQQTGPISFHDYMEMCLYYPELGYYTSIRPKIGSNGDFYTSATLTPVFGALMAKKITQMWDDLDRQPFSIVEIGAGNGQLCLDILTYLSYHNNALYDQLTYFILEKSPVMVSLEKSRICSPKVQWINSLCDLPRITGCILSNELLDNFAVHLVQMEDSLMEVMVDYQHGSFTEILMPASTAQEEYLNALGLMLPPGFRTEINLGAIEYLKQTAERMQRGFLMTIDYGYLSDQLMNPNKRAGTLVSYHHHKVNDRFYENPGEQDITAHVNFSALLFWGEQYGWREEIYTCQGSFLLNLGFIKMLEQSLAHEQDIALAARKAAVLNHVLIYDMGSKFKVLILEKQ
jgi:SAM-dependent MidA family methyltransferase